jgi:hypothetical protein
MTNGLQEDHFDRALLYCSDRSVTLQKQLSEFKFLPVPAHRCAQLDEQLMVA